MSELFLGVWAGAIENDGLNRLVLRAGLTARQVVVVRAFVKYLHQAGMRFTEASFADALAGEPRTGAARSSISSRPASISTSGVGRRTRERVEAIDAELERSIDAVASLDEDRILRALVEVVQAAVRTNAYRPGVEALSIKLDPSRLAFLPAPRPQHEIWVVLAARSKAVHLRGGDIARGGIRWSDRRDDFRTEILGLMKAQTEKNAVIVPVGAKGGFVVKRPPARAVRCATRCSRATRRSSAGCSTSPTTSSTATVVPPPSVVRHDGDDPTSSSPPTRAPARSPTSPTISRRSTATGSATRSRRVDRPGYDHKEMGITSRGAWISVRAHFRALGVDADAAELTVVGHRRHVGRRVRQRHAALAAPEAGGGLRPPPRVPRPRSRPGGQLPRSGRGAVPAPARVVVVGRLRPRRHLGGRRCVPAQRQVATCSPTRRGACSALDDRDAHARRGGLARSCGRPSTCSGTAGSARS